MEDQVWCDAIALSDAELCNVDLPVHQNATTFSVKMTGPNVLLLIGGGHASGKKTLAFSLREHVESMAKSSIAVEIVDMESYMDPNAVTTTNAGSKAAITVGHKQLLNLKPSRFDFDALKADLASNLASDGDKHKLIIVHGLYALYDRELCEKAQIKVYVGSDADTRLIRWIRRDVLSKNNANPTDLELVIGTYLNGAREEMRDYIFPTKERADVVLPRGAETNAVSLIADGLLPFLGDSGTQPISPLLRPDESTFQKERFNNERGKFYELS